MNDETIVKLTEYVVKNKKQKQKIDEIIEKKIEAYINSIHDNNLSKSPDNVYGLVFGLLNSIKLEGNSIEDFKETYNFDHLKVALSNIINRSFPIMYDNFELNRNPSIGIQTVVSKLNKDKLYLTTRLRCKKRDSGFYTIHGNLTNEPMLRTNSLKITNIKDKIYKDSIEERILNRALTKTFQDICFYGLDHVVLEDDEIVSLITIYDIDHPKMPSKMTTNITLYKSRYEIEIE
jgi:hypothetical protein